MTARLVACLECGEPMEAGSRDFCQAGCRKNFNNRRLTRGALLYDLYMEHRFARGEAQAQGVFQAINRLASDFRSEDRETRGGRRSWRRATDVLADRPHLRGIRHFVRAGR